MRANPDVEIRSEDRVWSGRFAVDLIEFRHRRFDGEWSGLRRWELFRRGRAAAILPYDPVADSVLLIEQFRLPALAADLSPVLVELPAGLCDGDEPPERTAHRELAEETGATADRLELIGQFLLTPGGSDECVTVYAGRIAVPAADADGVAGSGGLAAEHEDIRLRVWPAARAIERAVAGAFPNSVTAIALLWLAARRDWLRTRWASA